MIQSILCNYHKVPIIGVCLGDGCKNPLRAYCHECKELYHLFHQTKELNTFLNDTDNEKKFKEYHQKILQGVHQLDQKFKDIMTQKPDKVSTPDLLEVQVRYELNLKSFIQKGGLEELALKIQKLYEFLAAKLQFHSDSIKSQSQKFKQSNNEFQIKQQQAKENQIISNTLKQLALEEIYEKNAQNRTFQNQEQDFINDHSQSLTENQLIDSLNLQDNQQRYNFSKVHKSNKITLSEDQQSAGGENFALCDQSFNPNSINQFAFQILKCPPKEELSICIGICDQNFVILQNYQLGNGQFEQKHGAYLISQNGFIFTNIDKQFQEKNNRPSKQIGFGEQDIVFVTVDTRINQIKWEVQSSLQKASIINQSFKLSIDNNARLVPCVLLKNNAQVKLFYKK